MVRRGAFSWFAAVSCLVLLALLAACAMGGAKKSAAVQSAPASDAGREAAVMPDDPKSAIEKLDAEIAASRGQLALEEPMQADYINTSAEPMSAAPATSNPTCKPAQTDTCKTSCDLSSSICDNANKICTIAQKQLAGDTWAQGKCAKANKTCESSKTKCCGCT